MEVNKNNSEANPPDSAETVSAAANDEEGEIQSEAKSSSSDTNDKVEDMDEIAALNAQVSELNDQYLRSVAELDNLRRRNATELEKARKYAIDKFARDMLDILDSLDKACEIDYADNSEEQFQAINKGVELTRKQLKTTFGKYSIEEVSADKGIAFDAEYHQAMTMFPDSEVAPNHILQVIRKGYSIHDRLLRPAMVIVASAVPKNESDSDEDSPENGSDNA